MGKNIWGTAAVEIKYLMAVIAIFKVFLKMGDTMENGHVQYKKRTLHKAQKLNCKEF